MRYRCVAFSHVARYLRRCNPILVAAKRRHIKRLTMLLWIHDAEVARARRLGQASRYTKHRVPTSSCLLTLSRHLQFLVLMKTQLVEKFGGTFLEVRLLLPLLFNSTLVVGWRCIL